MIDLATATCETFETALKERLTVGGLEGDTLELELRQVDRRSGFDPAKHKRQGFALVFRGPPQPVLPQRIYALAGPTLGMLDVFLVPIGPGDGGMLYEAVFN